MAWSIVALIPVAAAISLVLTLAVRSIARRRSWMDTGGASGHRKETIRSVPNVGGIAITWAIAGPLLAGVGAAAVLPGVLVSSTGGAIDQHLPGIREQTPMVLALVGCLLAMHFIGLYDDRRALRPGPKLVAMAIASAVMVIGFDVRLLEAADAYVGGAWLSIALSILWFVLITNAINFVDNTDGLAGGICAVSGGLFLAAALVNGQWFIGATLALLVGSCIGFLVFNRPPATIFMGDGGSLVLGFLLSFLTVRTTYYDGIGSAWYAVFMPLCVLAVPLYDLTSVVIIRLSQGRSPFVGDQQHFSHRLAGRGLSQWRILIVIWGCVAITGIGGILLGRATSWQAILIGVQAMLVVLLIALFEHASPRTMRCTKGDAP